MITDPIHTEVICKLKYRGDKSKYSELIDILIDEVEKIHSFVTGSPGYYVFSAYRLDVSEVDLVSIINKYILVNLDDIKKYKIEILKY